MQKQATGSLTSSSVSKTRDTSCILLSLPPCRIAIRKRQNMLHKQAWYRSFFTAEPSSLPTRSAQDSLLNGKRTKTCNVWSAPVRPCHGVVADFSYCPRSPPLATPLPPNPLSPNPLHCVLEHVRAVFGPVSNISSALAVLLSLSSSC